jgi:fibronectin type 3 domain-containing protein
MTGSAQPRAARRRLFSEFLESRLLLTTVVSPTINTVTPAPGATAIALNVDITATLNLPNGGVDPNTVIPSNVYLYQTAFPNNNSKFVPASVKTTGGGDALLLSPLADLLPSTSYTFVVTAGVKDINGDAFTPYTEAFVTGNSIPAVSQSYAFSQTALPTTQGFAVTDVQIGPDGDLWASTETGQILRYGINSDGTLGTPQVITSLQTANGGNQLITGFAFDPSFVADPTKPMIWVSDTFYALSGATNAPNFTSKLTVMSGPNLGTVTDAIVNLPRSVADHVNDQPIFQPGTKNLFFCQAGQNAYGAPDSTWGNRSETMLSAAILEVNTAALNLSGPALNVLTPDVGGTYNPAATGAPLTVYATGIRNAFDLLFDDKGQLWAAANGSSSGGNSPAGGGAPALTNIQQVESDILIKVTKGAYYGHPDPARGQYVLDQGNPTTGAVPGLAFTAYPVGTAPDPKYKLPNYIFGLHASPDGIIEYQGSAFGGKLSGKFLVAEYSAPDDILVLSRDSSDNIVGGLVSGASSPLPDHAVTGFTHLNGPVSLVEDSKTGFVYVSELGANKITLLKPAAIKQQLSVTRTSVAFNTIATGNAGAGPSRVETVTITNNGADALTFASGAFSIINDPTAAPAASAFTIANAASLPTSLSTLGSSFTIQLQYTASVVGLQSAILQIKSNDPTTPTLDINLHGIGTAGQFGALEPSLVQVLRAHNIPTIVGAGPDDANINTVAYPEMPDASSQEVPMQVMIEATPGPVTITPIASFSASDSPVSTIGYYTPGNAASIMPLFNIATADAQTVDPAAVGVTSFDPGSSTFGLFGYFPGVTTPGNAPDYHYSEDALNLSLDPNNPRKIRFFPYETAAGAVVPNTFVFAVEDYNDPTYNSFVNFVGIISNVMGPPPAPANLAATSAAGAGVMLTWDASAGATSYSVLREDPGASAFAPITTGLTTPGFTDVNVTAGSTYQYEIQAQNAAGVSPFTAPLQATEPQVPPLTPGNFRVSSMTSSSVVLNWNPAAAASSYSIERQNPGASTFAQLATGITATTYTDFTVIAGQSYQYEVLATNSAGPSPVSAPIPASIPIPIATLDVTVGKGANKAVAFTSNAGTVVTIRFTGRGAATVHFAATTISQAPSAVADIVTGTNVIISSITTTATAANSVLTVATKGGSNTVNLGGISTDGPLNSINAGTSVLVGLLSTAGSVSKISLGSASAANITIGGALGLLQVPSVSGLTLAASGAIRSILSTTWASGQPITAPSIGTITIKDSAQLDISTSTIRSLRVNGTLHDSTFTLTGGGAHDLPVLFAGSINNTAIISSGSLGTISAASLVNSRIYAGAGSQAAFPPVSSFPTNASIAAIVLRKIRGAVSFTNSSIAASRITRLSLGNIQFSNGGLGFGAQATTIGVLSGADSSTGQAFTFARLTSGATVTADFASKKISPQDFEVLFA